MKYLFLFIFISTTTLAKDDKVFVHSFDEDNDMQVLDPAIYRPVIGSGQVKKSYKEMPSPQKLDKLFAEAGLSREVENFDQIEKDLLFRKVRDKGIETARESYPQISQKKLQKLKTIIEE